MMAMDAAKRSPENIPIYSVATNLVSFVERIEKSDAV
jgi:hypothetical protein